mgnify:CR=1 FL=1
MALRRFDLEAGGDSFSFKPETEDKIAFWRGKYPADKQRSAVIPMLWLAQKDNNGWLSEPAMREVADRLKMPYIRVYEVATFYSMFETKPVGRHHISVCTNISCMLCGGEQLLAHVERRLGVKVGEYAPTRIKLAVAGHGAAKKEQVSRMIRTVLRLGEELALDESDAAAAALCHAFTSRG